VRKINVLIGGLAICFDPVVKFTAGVVSENWKGSQFACEGLNARLDETVVRPVSEIQFEASGEVCAAGRPAEGSLEIGFVQSLLASERRARYGFGLATYRRDFSAEGSSGLTVTLRLLPPKLSMFRSTRSETSTNRMFPFQSATAILRPSELITAKQIFPRHCELWNQIGYDLAKRPNTAFATSLEDSTDEN
jgi:hypothetical protein